VKRQLAQDSSNSSTPPSKDSIAAKAKQRADRSSRERSPRPQTRWPARTLGHRIDPDTDAGSS
jgi:hypothetical protein